MAVRLSATVRTLDKSVLISETGKSFFLFYLLCECTSFFQGVGETDGLDQKAKASGAAKLYIGDLKEEFVKDFVFPCVRAGAVYERKYLLGTSMARPVIAKVTPGSPPWKCSHNLRSN